MVDGSVGLNVWKGPSSELKGRRKILVHSQRRIINAIFWIRSRVLYFELSLLE